MIADSGRRDGPTLFRRLGTALGARLLAAWAVTTVAVGAAVLHDLDELYEAGLLAVADVVVALDSAVSAPDVRWRAVRLDPTPRSHVDYRLRERAGGAAGRSADVGDGVLPRPTVVQRDGERVLRIALGPRAAGGTTRTVEIAQGLEDRRLALLDMLLTMLLPALLIVPVGVFGLRATLARELAPLDALATEIDRRGGDDLSSVAAVGVPGELGPIVRGLDRLLTRLRRALDAERDFAGTAAHELRTPLAGALAQTQRLLVETDGSVHARARRIERSLHALEHLSARLLELARAEGAGTRLERAIDLAPTLERTLAPIVARPGVGSRLVADVGTGSLDAHLDPDAFSILLGNLVENALSHGEPDAPVTVRRRGPCIDIDNAGRVLDTSELARLRQRYVRAGTSGGSGLGLAIVYAIVDGGGGVEVELLSPRPGRDDGVRARIRFEAPRPQTARLSST